MTVPVTTRPTLWQRFWRSPWTWLAFSINEGTAFFHGWQTGWQRWCAFVLWIAFALEFFIKGDKRWGRP